MTESQAHDWLEIHRGDAPLIVCFPHTGTDLPAEIEAQVVSPWLARKDADWWVHRLYDLARELGATTVRTALSRTVIDVNRDPSGASLYPGQATTGLCPLTTFDGEALYRPGKAPDAAAVAMRRQRWFDPYHAALLAEVQRSRARHGKVVLYDAHSIRSRVPRLFEGELPNLNIGTYRGTSCAPELTRRIEAACSDPRFSRVTDGRFVGGWTTRHYGDPAHGVHAVQMELACRGYLDEPPVPDAGNWPAPYDPDRAGPLRALLGRVLRQCIDFAHSPGALT
jgi:N-formylglutamate deformylase